MKMDPLKIEEKMDSLKKPKKKKKAKKEKKSEMDVLISKMKEAKKKEAKKKSKKKKSDLLLSKMKKGGLDVEIFKPKRRKKNKKAVLIGLKHPRQMNIDNIKGQILRMKDQLMKLRGFSETNITLMIDEVDNEDEDEQHMQPTDYNIRATLCSLVEGARPGDILFIHLIAYGCSDGRIITADGEHIHDCYFRALINIAWQNGCNLTFVSDCLIEPVDECPCAEIPIPNSFTDPGSDSEDTEKQDELLKEFFEDKGKRFQIVGYFSLNPTYLSCVDILNLNPNINKEKKTTHDDDDEDDEDDDYDNNADDDDDERGILLMPFIPDQKAKSWDVSELLCSPPLNGASPTTTSPQHTLYGVFTDVILDVIEETHGQVTNLELAQKAMDKLGQIPSLRCTDHHNAYASFVC